MRRARRRRSFSRMSSNLSRVSIALLLAAALSGCAGVPRTIGKGEPVAFVEEPLEQQRPEIALTNAAIGQAAKTGTGGGMIVGAAAGLTCGPAFFICSPLGAVVGGLGGAILGAGVGAAQALPTEVQEQLQRRIDTFTREHKVREHLMSAIVDRGRGHWVPVSAQEAPAVVRIRIESVVLYSDQAGRVGLAMRIVVITRPGETRSETTQAFDYVGVSSEPRLWIEDPDGFVAASFRQGYSHLGQSVFAYLAR